ncbi:hypothetical protein DSECCO2_404800 [anaerobic digester metagenome]
MGTRHSRSVSLFRWNCHGVNRTAGQILVGEIVFLLSHHRKDLVVDPVMKELLVRPMHGRFRAILTRNVEPGTPGGKDIQDAVEQSVLISTRSLDMRPGGLGDPAE